MANPPTFANVQTLLPLDGADGATSTTDVSVNTLTITFHGNAQLDTAESKFGGASLLLDGSGDYLRAALTGALMKFGAGDFTVEAWIRTSTANRFILDTGIYTGNPGRWALAVNASGRLTWWYTDFGGDAIDLAAGSTSVTTGAWVHVAACRTSSTLRLFVNGAVVGTFGGHTENYSTAGTHLFIGDVTVGGGAFAGHVDDLRIVAESVYPGAFTPPASAHPTSEPEATTAIAAAAGPLGEPAVLGLALYAAALAAGPLAAPRVRAHSLYGIASAATPLGNPSMLGVHDFTGRIDPTAPINYFMDLVTPGGLVRVPISSWQATLQTDVQSYVQCVVPAATDWVPDIEAATEFVITRRGKLLDGSSIEYEMARAPAQTVSLDGGSFNYTATISGYTAALPTVEAPPTALDRTLAGVRTVSRNSGNVRVRCAVDWLLRPGQRAYLGEEAIVVAFVNYYVPGFDQYMDLGTRA